MYRFRREMYRFSFPLSMNLPENANERTRSAYDKLMKIPSVRKLEQTAKDRIILALMEEQEERVSHPSK